MAKKALVLLAAGVEEMEAVITIDTLRRGEVEVTVAGVEGDQVIACSRGVKVQPDCDLATALSKAPFDAVVLPGGLQSAKILSKLESVKAILKDQEKCGRIVGAICAAPMALKEHQIHQGKNVTCYPALKGMFDAKSHNYTEARVVQDGTLITSQGPATALDFALALTESLVGREKRDLVAKEMLV